MRDFYMKHFFKNKGVILLSLFGFSIAATELSAQHFPSDEKFGKNRVQYRSFNWRIYQTSNFEVYFYQNGNNLARLTAQFAETEFDRITETLGYTPYNRIKIFLFNSPEEQEQSNIGIASLEELNELEVDLAQSRIEIAFTGDQISFRKQLVHDISMLFVYDMLYGGNLKDALQSSILLTLPSWFMSGIASYVADGWSPQLNDYMRDVILNRNVKRPSLLEGEDATLIGQSIWNYIAEKYGKDNISNILNLTRIIRTEQTSITSTLGIPSFGRFLREWRDYYAAITNEAAASYQEVTPAWAYKIGNLERLKTGAFVSIAPDNKMLAISEPHKRNYRILTYNLETGKKMVIRQGSILENHAPKNGTIPLIAWTRNNALAVLAPAYGRHNLYVYESLDTKKPRIRTRTVIRGLDHIVNMDISKDGTMLAVSADKSGQNDLYLISVGRGSTIPLTNDLYDDLSPRFIGTSNRRVAFASNRPSDSLQVKGDFKTIRNVLGIFEHDGTPRAATANKLLDSLGTYNLPVYSTDNELYFLSDTKGIQNIFKYDYRSKRLSQSTNSSSGLRNAAISPVGNGGLAYLRLDKGDLKIAYANRFQTGAIPETPSYRKGAPGKPTLNAAQAAAGDTAAPPAAEADKEQAVAFDLRPGEVDTDNYQFDEDVIQSIGTRFRSRNSGDIPSVSPRLRKRENITITGPFNYKGLFITNDASSNWRVDPIKGFGYQQLVSMNDLLENHVLKAGGFLSMSGESFFRTYDAFMEYNLNKYRVDYSVRYDRSSLFIRSSYPQKYRFNRVSLTAAYPFTRTSRISVSPTYTSTYLIETTTARPIVSSQYLGFKTELVFDNSTINGMNMTEGTKFKIRYENHLGISRLSDSFYRVGLDFRRYQKLHRDLILAVRLAAGHSGGRSPKYNSMGGMENWVGRKYDNNDNSYNPFDFSENADNRDIFFTEFATNLRGFNMNRLSGVTYMMANVELRVPLVKYLYRGPITSNFLRNLQFAGFTDIGTAWTGKGPFSQENSLNTEVVGGNGLPFRATVVNFRNPYIWGYGIGVRTMIFGIYGKFDYAWGVDNSILQKPIPYLTLGYDF